MKFTTTPRVEALSADGGSNLLFAESSTARKTPPTAGANGTPFPAPVAVLLAKCLFVMSWHHVPHNYISTDPDILRPKRFLNIMGKTNSDPFLGFDISTLIAEPPVFEEVLFPVCANDSYDLLTGWNCHIGFNFFDPDWDPLANPPSNPTANPPVGSRISVPGSTYRGHNLMPFRNGGFYLATRDGVAAYSAGPPIAGERLLPTAAFWDIFKHHAAP